LGIGAVAAFPSRLDEVAQALIGKRIEESAVRAAVVAALENIEPMSDLHASGEYRRRVAATLAVRAIMSAEQAARDRHAR
jgi:CO/xanthine dehydrogenase FAD-binding subunit